MSDKLVVEVYHILLLLLPIVAGACTAVLMIWKYLLAPAVAHRQETDLAIHVLKIDVISNQFTDHQNRGRGRRLRPAYLRQTGRDCADDFRHRQ